MAALLSNNYSKNSQDSTMEFSTSTNSKNKKLVNLESLTYRSEKLSLEDAQIVANQLEITPLNLIEIGARNSLTSDPLTLILYPLNHADTPNRRYCNGTRQPFPTIFWMSCPDLRAKISRLEHFRLGNLIQDLLDRNSITNYELPQNSAPILHEFYNYLKDYYQEFSPAHGESFQEQMRKAHLDYALERWNLLREEDLDHIRSSGWEHALNTRVGIAGMKKFTQVKCLHTHYAHYITRPEHGNVIGRWVHEVLVREGSIPRNYFTHDQPSNFAEQEMDNKKASSDPAVGSS